MYYEYEYIASYMQHNQSTNDFLRISNVEQHSSIWMAKAARAHAFMKRRGYVIPEDIKALAPDILRHRVIPTYEAEARDITSDDIVARILEAVEVP